MSLNVSGLSKTEIRLLARRLRRGMDIKSISAAACNILETLSAFQHCDTVLGFHAMPHEINLMPLMNRHPDKHWYLPRIHSGHLLSFHRYHDDDDLYPHAFGILEPSPNTQTLEESGFGQAIIFVPGLVFDRRGHRLGYGKGFYDRVLASLNPNIISIGTVPEELLADGTLPTEELDLPVSIVVTQQQAIHTVSS